MFFQVDIEVVHSQINLDNDDDDEENMVVPTSIVPILGTTKTTTLYLNCLPNKIAF